MALVSMKSDDSMGGEGMYEVGSSCAYPSGLMLHLDDDTCEKLGIMKAMKPGMQVSIQAMAVVTRSSEALEDDGDDKGNDVSLCLQITDMQAKPAGMLRDAASVLYPKE